MTTQASSSPLAAVLPLVPDTNILVHAVRGNQAWQKIKTACDPLMVEPAPSICVVSDGELRSFAEQQDWGDVRRNQMLFLLSHFRRAGIDSLAVLQAYADIEVFSRRVGIKMGKNGLWIAAVTHAYGAVLVTADKDFGHLDGVFFTRLLITL